MLAKSLKNKLDEGLIVKILENIDCHSIKVGSKRITCALPDGDNKGSVCIYTDNEFYHSEIFTRSEFQAKELRDIISIVEFIKGVSFIHATKIICDICGFDFYGDIQEDDSPKILKWLDFVESGISQEEKVNIKPLPDSVLNQFYINPVTKWWYEGISAKAQREFEIGIDVYTDRITIPIRDELGTLVGVKGRLLEDGVGEDKYVYLINCPKSQILYGLHKNYQEIKKQNEIIVVEGEKSVIKLHSIGFKNAIAIGSKSISDTQIEKILRLNVPVTLSLDQDVSQEEIEKLVERFVYPIKTVPINIIKDDMGLLKEKESPSDREEIWKLLYTNFKIAI